MNWSDVLGLVLTLVWAGCMTWLVYQSGYQAGERRGRTQGCGCRLAQRNGERKDEGAE